jgi:hypothetical protein
MFTSISAIMSKPSPAVSTAWDCFGKSATATTRPSPLSASETRTTPQVVPGPFAAPATMAVYAQLPPETKDALTAGLAGLAARMKFIVP